MSLVSGTVAAHYWVFIHLKVLHTVVGRFLTSYKLFLFDQVIKIALRETLCKKLKSVPPLCVTSSECRALFWVENLALSFKDSTHRRFGDWSVVPWWWERSPSGGHACESNYDWRCIWSIMRRDWPAHWHHTSHDASSSWAANTTVLFQRHQLSMARPWFLKPTQNHTKRHSFLFFWSGCIAVLCFCAL